MDIFSAIGNTPLVQLKTLTNGTKAKIFGKLEGSNPGGSIKDRPAYYMIKKAEESGVLTRGKTILEATSGNTGIAIAMIGRPGAIGQARYSRMCQFREKPHPEAYGAEVI